MRTAHAAAALGAALAIGVAACGGTPPPSTRPAPPAASPAAVAERRDSGPGRPAVAGRLKTPDGRPLLSAVLVMVPAAPETSPGTPRDVRVHPDGTFTFRDVPAGRYEIRARGETDASGTPLVATLRLTVDDRDIRNLDMSLLPGADVAGRVRVEGTTRRQAPLTGVRVRAPLADGSSFGDAVTGDLTADGTFVIRGLLNGLHVLTLEGLPDPWVLSRVTLGDDDITDSGIDVEGGQRVTGVLVVITDIASEVTGVVLDATGAAAGGALVAVVPAATAYWSRASRRLRVVRADATGRYRVRGMPDGEYRVAATRASDERDVYRTEALRELSARGVPLTLAGAEPRVVDLTLPPSIARRTTSR
jgi:hypothetical protein